jgi:hypothetical protein
MLIGRTADSKWVEVRLPDGVTGWVITNQLKLAKNISVKSLLISNRSVDISSATATPDGNPNELLKDVGEEIIEEVIEEAIEKNRDAPTSTPKPTATLKPSPEQDENGGDTLILPCVPGSVPPGYICTCNCV